MALPRVSPVHRRVIERQAEKIADAVITGKPLPRQVARKRIPKNNFWDDANYDYHTAMDGVAMIDGTLLDAAVQTLNDPEKLAKIEHPEELALALNILQRDLESHIKRLNDIHDQHKDIKGSASIQDISKVLEFKHKYMEAHEVYEGVVVPMHAQILRLLGDTQVAGQAILNTPDEPNKAVSHE